MSRSDLLPIEQTIQSALDTYFPDTPNPVFVMGVSGGVDSMCLVHLFYRLQVEAFVVHINYGKRGKASDKDAQLVERMSSEWGFDSRIVTADSSQNERENFQQWARNFRYEIFKTTVMEQQADGIALAHHQDDQIETILQKQFRGAGLESWSAMQVWDGNLFRPLLPVSRQQIEQYVEKKGIPYRTDESNLENDFARNFLRNEWIPKLEKHFPGWKKNVLRIPEKAQLFEQGLQWISDRLTDSKDRISRDVLTGMDTELMKAVILQKLKQIDPDLEVSVDALHELEKIDQLQTGKRIQLTETLSVMRDREWFKIVYEKPNLSTIQTLELDALEEHPFSFNEIEFYVEDYTNPNFGKNLYLDTAKISGPVKLRKWRSGDRFQPLGMDGHQNVSDHLTNRKVAATEKQNALVLETFEETICAVIFPPIEKRVPPGTISEEVKCEDSTRKCLMIKPN